MKKVISVEEAAKISAELREKGRNVVIAGGCFDILHVGHIAFLEHAKEHGDVMFILLESDDRIRMMKGEDRPVNNQHDRAQLLSALSVVDYVVLLPFMVNNQAYDELIFTLKPAIIATTKQDPGREHKERQANAIGASLLDVVERIKNRSTTRVAQLLRKEL